MKNNQHIIITIFLFVVSLTSFGQTTKIQYLSGRGSDKTVDWQFFCTAGMNSGKWTTIPVPSNWELQGFGSYNYGQDKDSIQGREKGLYKYKFQVPSDWKGKVVNIVFEGAMTDTEVKINGKLAGPVHQGAFYCFRYDVSSLLSYGKSNMLDVTVSKHSANESVNGAERHGDFWIFGGIFRPVYLEALPQQHIGHIAIDAKDNGHIVADIYLKNINKTGRVIAQVLALDGTKVGQPFSVMANKGATVVQLSADIVSPKQWSPEFPNLYQLEVSFEANGEVIHTVNERFGFRTVELRERDGIFVNGQKVKFKGVARHSFWPTTGRALSKTRNIEDVRLMKDMNMNAVRMSHYPPDKDFLDACDSLGLFVLDELGGWHHAYDTEVGTKLVNEMVMHDVNHPSIVIWDNGNEGGHNTDLDLVFDKLDIQKRSVIHPWRAFRGIDTQHYISYGYGNNVCFNSHNVFFPTEFLHGLYDGGNGSGLEDYWEMMWNYPRSAGGFLWDFADEGVVRTDRNGKIDTDGVHAPDGIVGAFHEKEGSYFTIKEVWSPVRFEAKDITQAFDKKLNIENRYIYTNLNQCTFRWKLAQVSDPYQEKSVQSVEGAIKSPDVAPGQKGVLSLGLPDDWGRYDILYVTATDPHGKEIYSWSWPVSLPQDVSAKVVATEGKDSPKVSEDGSLLNVTANSIKISFDKKTGLLVKVENTNGPIPFNNGPVLCAGKAGFKSMDYHYDGNVLVIKYSLEQDARIKELTWRVFPSGWLGLNLKYFPEGQESEFSGISFSYPESEVTGVKWLGDGPYRVWKNRMKGVTLNVWEKAYNNTMTGVPPYVYPEFKGYHSRLYWAKLLTKGQPVTIVTSSEDIFLRLFTPQKPEAPYNTAPSFPSGDISFMQGIPPMGTKVKKPKDMGPSGALNMFYDFGQWDDWQYRVKEMSLYFDFSGK